MAVTCPKCHFENPSDTRFYGNCAAPLSGTQAKPFSPVPLPLKTPGQRQHVPGKEHDHTNAFSPQHPSDFFYVHLVPPLRNLQSLKDSSSAASPIPAGAFRAALPAEILRIERIHVEIPTEATPTSIAKLIMGVVPKKCKDATQPSRLRLCPNCDHPRHTFVYFGILPYTYR